MRPGSLEALLGNLSDVLKQIEDIVNRYQSLGRDQKKTWDRVKFAKEDLTALRSKLSVHMAGINLFMSSLSVGSLARIEGILDELVQDIKAGRKEPTVISANDESDEVAWSELERELIGDGITKQDLERHKEEIKEYLKKLIVENLVGIGSESTDSLAGNLEDMEVRNGSSRQSSVYGDSASSDGILLSDLENYQSTLQQPGDPAFPPNPRVKTPQSRRQVVQPAPVQQQAANSSLSENANPNPPESWIARLDRNSNTYYYIHLPTKATQWENPQGHAPLNYVTTPLPHLPPPPQPRASPYRQQEQGPAEALAPATSSAVEEQSRRQRDRSPDGHHSVESLPVSVKVNVHSDTDRNVTLRRLTEQEVADEREAQQRIRRMMNAAIDDEKEVQLETKRGDDTVKPETTRRRLGRKAPEPKSISIIRLTSISTISTLPRSILGNNIQKVLHGTIGMTIHPFLRDYDFRWRCTCDPWYYKDEIEFDVIISKIPLVSLYGIIFNRLRGDKTEFKNTKRTILRRLSVSI